MRKIKLTQGKHALVDNWNYDGLNETKWCAVKGGSTWYVVGKIEGCQVRMHRIILGLVWGDGKSSDHINHNGLDNQEHNLRICTPQQNSRNTRPRRLGKFKGVCFIPKGRHGRAKPVWQAAIKMNNQSIHLGYFKNQIDAAIAYDTAAKGLFGEFAYLNFPACGLIE